MTTILNVYQRTVWGQSNDIIHFIQKMLHNDYLGIEYFCWNGISFGAKFPREEDTTIQIFSISNLNFNDTQNIINFTKKNLSKNGNYNTHILLLNSVFIITILMYKCYKSIITLEGCDIIIKYEMQLTLIS